MKRSDLDAIWKKFGLSATAPWRARVVTEKDFEKAVEEVVGIEDETGHCGVLTPEEVAKIVKEIVLKIASVNGGSEHSPLSLDELVDLHVFGYSPQYRPHGSPAYSTYDKAAGSVIMKMASRGHSCYLERRETRWKCAFGRRLASVASATLRCEAICIAALRLGAVPEETIQQAIVMGVTSSK